MYQSHVLVESGEEEAKGKFEFPDSSFVGFGTISTRKRRIHA
jgi:hypothetical protein